MDVASRYRELFLYNIYQMGKNSIEKGSRDNWTVTPKVIAAAEKAASAMPRQQGGASGEGGRGAAVVAPEIYTSGISVHVASGRRNERAMTAGLKTIAFTESLVALAEARAAGADDAIFLDTEGHVSEGTSSNVFVATVVPCASTSARPTRARPSLTASAGSARVESTLTRVPVSSTTSVNVPPVSTPTRMNGEPTHTANV
jgi:hypothetical protein